MTQWPEHFQPDIVRDGFGGKLSSYTIALEAWRRGLKVSFLDPELRRYRVEDDAGHAVTFIRSRPHMSTWEAVRVANDKAGTNEALRQAGLPVPGSVVIDPAENGVTDVKREADKLGYPVVLKPLKGSMGHGVFSGIAGEQELERRFKDLASMDVQGPIVLESHVRGEDYRVLVYGTRVVAACKRVPANITGDGVNTVQQLIDRKNTLRRENPFLSKGLIKRDHEVEDYLSRHGYDFNSTPARGEYIQLRSAANASAGGDVVDVTWQLPQSIRETAIRATQAIPGLYCAGVDVLYDPAAAAVEDSYAVLELNAHPQIGVNMYPTHGRGVDVPRHIIDLCFPSSKRHPQRNVEQLCFPLGDLIAPLKRGSASEVSPRPLPRHRYSVRVTLQSDEPLSLTKSTGESLSQLARTHRVSGHAEHLSTGRVRLVVAGSHRGSGHFLTAVKDTLGDAFSQHWPWKGPIEEGFTILWSESVRC